MVLVGIGLAWAGNKFGSKAPIFVAAGAAGILFLLACLFYPEFAFYTYLCSIIIFTIPARLFGVALPLGVLIPGSGYLCALSVLASQYRKRTNSADFWKTPISLMTLVIFFYLMLEAFNPEIEGRAGWWNFFQKQILYLVYYYTCFLMFDSLNKIRRFIKIWIILAAFIALWGIKQQWLGFTAFEDAWIHSDPLVTNLLYQGGMFRKFSLLPDPASFGVLCASSALFTLVLAIRLKNKKVKRPLYIVTFLQMLATTYSGTRTCNVMLIGGLLAYILFTINERRTIRVLISSVLVALFLLFGPTRNSPIIFRIKTTFEGSKEPSNMVRDVNRRNIQPYIHEHPIGGGLHTSGEEGTAFYPTHRLAGYPPDSGYMKILMEEGWVGFGITMIFYFLILYTGIMGFYNSRKEEIKTYYIAFTICFFALAVGMYSQLGISQYPQYLFYLATLVIFYKLKDYDTKPKEEDELENA